MLRVLVAVAAVVYLVSGLWQAAHDSPTVDEAVDVSSGVATLVRHDLRMNPEHAPLPKVLSALPALLAQPVVPDGDAWRSGDWFDFTDEFVRANREAGRLDRVGFLARLVPLAEGLACAWLIFVLARRFFGPVAGMVGAFFWLTTPAVVGLAHFAGIDIAFTLATLFVSYRLLRHVDAPSVVNAAALGGACALALLTRHSALGLWAYAVVLVAAMLWSADRRQALRCAAIVVLVGFAGVWIAMRVLAPSVDREFSARADALVSDATDRSLAARASLAIPFPTEYRAGLAYLVVTSEERPAYLFGQAWRGSRLWFFPGSVVAKVPLGALASLALAPLALRRRVGLERRRLAAVVVGPAVVSFAFVLAQPLNLGMRYVMPSLALAFVLTGALVAHVVGRRRRVVAAAALLSQLVAVGSAGAHSLAWTSPAFTPAYRFVSDSNLDYGQDTDRVAVWSRDHPGAWVALLRPRGVDNPEGTRELRGVPASSISGWVAVSATRLTVIDRDELSWIRAYCPVGDIGGSVLLYRFDGVPDTRPGPTMPVAPCSGAAASTRR